MKAESLFNHHGVCNSAGHVFITLAGMRSLLSGFMISWLLICPNLKKRAELLYIINNLDNNNTSNYCSTYSRLKVKSSACEI